MHRSILLITALLVACGGHDYAVENDLTDTDSLPDTGDTDSPNDDSDLLDEPPEFWSLDGDLVVLPSGELDAEAATLILGYWTADDELCTATAPIAASAVATPDPDVPLFGWWRVTLAESDGCPGLPSLTGVLNVGIGAWDVRLDPAAASQDLDISAQYGLYLQDATVAAAPVFVYGAATDADGDAPVTDAPLPAGTYTLTGLHLLPL